MLLTVKETAEILGVDTSNIYYLVSFSKLDSVRILYDIRITEQSLREEYDRRCRESRNNQELWSDIGFCGFDELIANIRKKRLQNYRTKTYKCVQRGGGMELPALRCNCLSRPKQPRLVQLEFDF